MAEYILKCIGGSNTYGINTGRSDIDILQVDPVAAVTERRFGGYGMDIYNYSTGHFATEMLGPRPHAYFTQLLFPASFVKVTRISNFIIKNREEIIGARRGVLYNVFQRQAAIVSRNYNQLYTQYPKLLTYSTLFYSILASYAEGMSFARAHRPEGELHDFLISMRLGQVPLAGAVVRNKLERRRAEKAAGFYKEDVHSDILREFEQVIWEEAEKKRQNNA